MSMLSNMLLMLAYECLKTKDVDLVFHFISVYLNF